MTCPYKTLGLTPGADAEAVRSAYRKIVMQHHPDRSADARSKEIFLNATAAYELLMDTEARAALSGPMVLWDGRQVDPWRMSPEEAKQELQRATRAKAQNEQRRRQVDARIKAKHWKENDPRIPGVYKPLDDQLALIERLVTILSALG